MSTFESYLFEKTTEPLTAWQIEEVEEFSSRIEVTPHHAYVEYNYGSFKPDPIEVLESYFDCFRYYFAHSGGRLAYCFDTVAIDLNQLKLYQVENYITLREFDTKVVIDVSLFTDCPPDAIDLHFYDKHNPFTEFHNDTLIGDYRWLEIVHFFALKKAHSEDCEIDVPLMLHTAKLETRHRKLAEFFLESQDILDAIETHTASTLSGEFEPSDWVDGLSRNNMMPIISTLILEPHRARHMLLHHLKESFSISGDSTYPAPKISVKGITSLVREIQQKRSPEEQ